MYPVENFTLDSKLLHNQRLWWLWQIWGVPPSCPARRRMKVLFRCQQDYTIIYRLYRKQYHGFCVRYQISNIAKIANISNIANIPIVANIDEITNIEIITKVVKVAKITKIVKIAKIKILQILPKLSNSPNLTKTNKIHKCALNSTNV